MAAGDIRAGGAFVEATLRDSNLRRGLARASRRLKKFGASVQQIGLRMAGVGAAIVGPLILASKKFANVGDNLEKMARRTTLSVEALSELEFAAVRSGSTLDDLERAILRMNRRLGRITAGQGSAEQAEAIEQLGLSAEKLERLDAEGRLLAIANAMASMGDQSEAAGLAQRAFGRQVDEILPLLLEGREGIENLRQEARDLGVVLSAEDAKAAAQFTDALGDLRLVMRGVVVQVGAALGPALTKLARNIATAMSGVIEFVRENRGLVGVLATVGVTLIGAGAAIAGVGTAIVAAGALIASFSAILGAVGTVASGVAVVFGAVSAALAGSGMAIVGSIALAIVALGSLRETFLRLGRIAGDAFDGITSDFRAAWDGILQALAAGDLASIGKIVMATLKLTFERGVASIKLVWIDLTTGMQALWTDMAQGVFTVVESLFAGMKAAVARAQTFIKQANVRFHMGFNEESDRLVENFERLLQAQLRGIERVKKERIAAAKAERDEELGAIEERAQARAAELDEAIKARQRELQKALAGIKERKDAEQKARKAGPGFDEIMRNASPFASRGTFSGFQQGLSAFARGGGNVVDQIAQATKRTADAAEETARNTEEGATFQ